MLPHNDRSHWSACRSQLRLVELDCNVLHCAGVNSEVADALSLLRTSGCVEKTLEDKFL